MPKHAVFGTWQNFPANEHLMSLVCMYQKLRENTEELASGAQDFASMAKELAKRMENRKWWQI